MPIDFHGRTYTEVPAEDARAAFLQEDYIRRPGRTDAFEFLCHETAGKTRAILLTPALRAHLPTSDLIAEKWAPWHYAEFLPAEVLDAMRSREVPADYQDLLYYDGMVEGDSLRLLNAVITGETEFPAEFWPVMMLWLRDEANHRDGYRAVYQTLYSDLAERDRVADAEVSDFSALQPVLQDPLSLLLALSIDELQTIFAYRNDLAKYEQMHPAVRAFTTKVIADEGWHLQKFLNLAARYYGTASDTKLAEAWQRVMDVKTAAYTRTFAFDQGDRAGAKTIDTATQHLVQERVWDMLQKRLGRMITRPGTLEGNATADCHHQSGQGHRDSGSAGAIAH